MGHRPFGAQYRYYSHMVKKLFLITVLALTMLTTQQAFAIDTRDAEGIEKAENYLEQITPTNAPRSPLGFDTNTLQRQEDVVPLGQTIISTLTGFLAAIAGTYAVFMILRYSYTFITSDGDSKKAEEGRKGMIFSIIGLVGIMLSYLIIYTIVDTLFRIGTPGQGL